MGLVDDLGSGPTGLDTTAFIYYIQEHHRYLPLVEPVFLSIAQGQRVGATSALTLLETLVTPYRAGDVVLAERYEALLTRCRGLRLVEIDRGQLRAAAHLRTRYRVRTPDALQLVAALAQRCTAFVTNDRQMPAISGLSILQLDDYL